MVNNSLSRDDFTFEVESKNVSKLKEMNLFSKMYFDVITKSKSLEGLKEKEIPSSLSLSQLVASISEEVSGKKTVNVPRIRKLLENYDNLSGEWKRYAFWKKNKLYTRNLIATDNETFTLMLLCWNPGVFSPIHAHVGVECVLSVIQGEMHEKLYEYPEEDAKELKHIKTTTLKVGESAFINDTIAIHSVGNSSSQAGATLHCYIPPYKKCKCFLDESSAEFFDSNVTFDSEHGELFGSCGIESITTCSALDEMTESKSLEGLKEEIPSSLSLSQLVASISEELSGKKTVNVPRIRIFLENYDYSSGEWKQYAFWKKNKLYTRNLIATDNETFTLMLLCWNPGVFSPIHAHAGVECAMTVIQGEMQEKLYEYPEEDAKELKHIKTTTLKVGESAFINDTIAIHSVGNPSSQAGATLHCYIPPYKKCKCFLDESSTEFFDANVTFDSERGELLGSCDIKSITTCST